MVKRTTIVCIFLLQFCCAVYCQENAQYYKEAVNFVCSNKSELKDIWVRLVRDNSDRVYRYKKLTKKEFNIFLSDTVSFKDILPFKDIILKDSTLAAIPVDMVMSGIAFGNAYSFSAYKSDTLGLLITEDCNCVCGNFYINFSRPTSNFLIGEMWYKDFGRPGNNRIGDTIYILFSFDENGKIKKVSYERAMK